MREVFTPAPNSTFHFPVQGRTSASSALISASWQASRLRHTSVQLPWRLQIVRIYSSPSVLLFVLYAKFQSLFGGNSQRGAADRHGLPNQVCATNRKHFTFPILLQTVSYWSIHYVRSRTCNFELCTIVRQTFVFHNCLQWKMKVWDKNVSHIFLNDDLKMLLRLKRIGARSGNSCVHLIRLMKRRHLACVNARRNKWSCTQNTVYGSARESGVSTKQ